jgi:single-stranded DNA-specific DHH superfamily exonuclease
MIYCYILGFCVAVAVVPFLVRALRSRWGSPGLRATLQAVAIAAVLDMLPLIFLLVRGRRSPIKK